MGGLSIWHWLIVLVVVVLIFGTKKLRNIGQDLGGAVKGFKEGMKTPRGRGRRSGRRAAAVADSRQDDRRRGEEGNQQVDSAAARGVRVRHVRHRLLRNRRHRRRGADRDRPRAAAEGGAHARPSVRPPAALRQRRQGGHQPRDGARRAPQAAAAGADRGSGSQVVGRIDRAKRRDRRARRRARLELRHARFTRAAETSRLAEPGPLPNEPGGELADAAPAEPPRQPALPGFEKI